MAIFTKKEICPVCGKPIKGDVRIRIKDNVELCKTCSSEIEMDSSMIPNQTVEDIKTHLAYRRENAQKVEEFETSRSVKAGAYVLRVDETRQWWYCTNDRSDRNPPIFAFSDLKSAVYLEDDEPAGELKTGLKSMFGEKEAPKLIQSMKIVISIDDPYIHSITVETLGVGEGMTTGTMQYKMNRKTIKEFMDCLMFIQGCAATAANTPPPTAEEAPQGANAFEDRTAEASQEADTDEVWEEEPTPADEKEAESPEEDTKSETE